jgi:hypothetical protein
MQTDPADPMQASTSWQDFNTGVKHVDQAPHPHNLEIALSNSRPGTAYPNPKPAVSGFGSLPETTNDGQFTDQGTSTWCLNDNVWPATGNTWSNNPFPVSDESSLFPSWSSRPRVQMDMNVYQNSSPVNEALAAWDTTLDAGHSPLRIQDMLIGMQDCRYQQEDYHRNPAMQEYDGSDVSSLSSSFPYDHPVTQPSVMDQRPPSHVPWSRPQTYGEGIPASSSWTQSLVVPTPLTVDLFSERSGTRPCSCLWIGWNPLTKPIPT